MSILSIIRANLGQSNTPANNFTLTAEADNGTMKLARGNPGATTQDILTVDAAGKVAAPTGLLGFNFSLSANGYIQFPSWCFGGFVLQWGSVSASVGGTAVVFPISFPSACYAVFLTLANNGATAYLSTSSPTSLTGCTVWASTGTPGAFWLALGK